MARDPSKTLKQATTNTGNTYRKAETSDGGVVYMKNGKFTSKQSFSAGYGEAVKGNGQIEADNGQYRPDAEVTVPTPDGPQKVRRDTAGRISDAVNGRAGNVDINGTMYSPDELEQAWRNAQEQGRTVRGQVVKY